MTVEKARSLLGVSAGATIKEVGSAYRRLSKDVHPDKLGGDESAFVRLSNARALLERELLRDVFAISLQRLVVP